MLSDVCWQFCWDIEDGKDPDTAMLKLAHYVEHYGAPTFPVHYREEIDLLSGTLKTGDIGEIYHLAEKVREYHDTPPSSVFDHNDTPFEEWLRLNREKEHNSETE